MKVGRPRPAGFVQHHQAIGQIILGELGHALDLLVELTPELQQPAGTKARSPVLVRRQLRPGDLQLGDLPVQVLRVAGDQRAHGLGRGIEVVDPALAVGRMDRQPVQWPFQAQVPVTEQLLVGGEEREADRLEFGHRSRLWPSTLG